MTQAAKVKRYAINVGGVAPNDVVENEYGYWIRASDYDALSELVYFYPPVESNPEGYTYKELAERLEGERDALLAKLEDAEQLTLNKFMDELGGLLSEYNFDVSEWETADGTELSILAEWICDQRDTLLAENERLQAEFISSEVFALKQKERAEKAEAERDNWKNLHDQMKEMMREQQNQRQEWAQKFYEAEARLQEAEGLFRQCRVHFVMDADRCQKFIDDGDIADYWKERFKDYEYLLNEINQFLARLDDGEKGKHYHVSQSWEGGFGNNPDACAECGEDLRHPVHIRGEMQGDES